MRPKAKHSLRVLRFMVLLFVALFSFITESIADEQKSTTQNLPHFSRDERSQSGSQADQSTPNITINIQLTQQRMQVFVAEALWYDWPISTGRQEQATPTGSYGITRMHRSYFSKTYDYIPMPHSLFFYQGMAIHGTYDIKNLGAPVSRGCVRLPLFEAQVLYELVYNFGAKRTKIRVVP